MYDQYNHQPLISQLLYLFGSTTYTLVPSPLLFMHWFVLPFHGLNIKDLSTFSTGFMCLNYFGFYDLCFYRRRFRFSLRFINRDILWFISNLIVQVWSRSSFCIQWDICDNILIQGKIAASMVFIEPATSIASSKSVSSIKHSNRNQPALLVHLPQIVLFFMCSLSQTADSLWEHRVQCDILGIFLPSSLLIVHSQ